MTPERLQREVAALLKANTREKDGHVYTVPSPETYPYQWLWDSCFHAIAFSHFDVERAKTELRSLVSAQYDNGLMPHMIYWQRGPQIDIKWGIDEERSTITQPPILAYAVWRIYEQDKDEAFLKELYPKLYHYYKYLISERDPHERRLIGLINPDESGEDNSPRFDTLLGLPPVHAFKENLGKRLELVEDNKKCNFDAPFCMKNFFWVKDVPFNAIMVKDLEILSQIAMKLGNSYDAEYFSRIRGEMIASMRTYMLEDGLFWSTFGEHYGKIKVKTWAIFAPLFAEMLSREEAKQLVHEHLLDRDAFWTEYPIATVAMTEPSFNPKDMWRGPTWHASNWLVYQGLKHYGFSEEIEHIKNSTLRLLEQSGFREYYDPRTGEGLGAHDFTWGCLALDML